MLKNKIDLYLQRETKVHCKPGMPEHYAGIAQLVEHDLAKVGVASSSLVSRSKIKRKTKVLRFIFGPDGGMVDTKDLKSFGLTAVGVQVPLRVP